jgi:hypothetical protein
MDGVILDALIPELWFHVCADHLVTRKDRGFHAVPGHFKRPVRALPEDVLRQVIRRQVLNENRFGQVIPVPGMCSYRHMNDLLFSYGVGDHDMGPYFSFCNPVLEHFTITVEEIACADMVEFTHALDEVDRDISLPVEDLTKSLGCIIQAKRQLACRGYFAFSNEFPCALYETLRDNVL